MNADNTTVILGPPGAGKTTRLLRIMEEEIAAGTPSTRIAFLAFTKKAANEARGRAIEKFKFGPEDLPWVRTIHSLTFERLALRRNEVAGRQHYQQLGEMMGIDFTGRGWNEDGVLVGGSGTGDKLVYLENLARVMEKPLKEVWLNEDHAVEWPELEQFSRAYRTFKQNRGIYDFTDLLSMFVESGSGPAIDTLMVDESQDLSRLQWRVIEVLSKGCKRVYVCGDDDQSCFRFAGADTDYFIDLPGKAVVLDQSYRITPAAHDLSDQVVRRLSHRREKAFKPRAGSHGEIMWHNSLDELDLSGTGTWLLLARNTYMLNGLIDYCMQVGVNFDAPGSRSRKARLIHDIQVWERLRQGQPQITMDVVQLSKHFSRQNWSRALYGMNQTSSVSIELLRKSGLDTEAVWYEAMDRFPSADRDFFRAVRARGEKLVGPARVQISTIHGVKGGEADNVLLMTDLAYAPWKRMQRDPDDEIRCMYVGLTRSLGDVHILAPQSNLYFEI